MIRIGFSLLLLAASAHAVIKSAGCGVEADFGSALGGPSRRFAVEHPAPDAQNRFANLHVAKKYDFNKPSPVIVAFHGKNQEIEAFEAATSLSDPEVNQDFIVVYPEAVNGMWTSDPEAPIREERNDVGFVEALLDYLANTAPLCIDLTRIYALGFSNGGGLTAVLSCDHFMSKRFAAHATAAGAFYRPESLVKEPGLAWCNPSRSPVPFLTFHGDADLVIDYYGVGTPDGETFELPKWMTGRAMRAGCDMKKGNKTTKIGGNLVDKVKWYCPRDVGDDAIMHYRLKGVGHMWPRKTEAGPGEKSKTVATIDGTRIVLKWFSKHVLPNEFVPATRRNSESQNIVYDDGKVEPRDEL